MTHGKYTAIKDKNLHAEIRSIKINGELTYMCKIKNKIYKMTPDEFRTKWRPFRMRHETGRLF